jgi:hypothetical protein
MLTNHDEPELDTDTHGDGRPTPLFWICVAVFFAIGATIGVSVSLGMTDAGESVLIATALGSTAGGLGAWLCFFLASRAKSLITRMFLQPQILAVLSTTRLWFR